jgi:hypothetical protein
MKILVTPGDWGAAQPAVIEVLLLNVASQLNKNLREPFLETIKIEHVPPSEPPRAVYRHSKKDPFTIRLSARDTYWAQFAFQFSHEFCHLLSGFEELKNNPNNWFHEAICDLASVFTLRRMAVEWLMHPPYSHWDTFAPHLLAYATQYASRPEAQLPAGTTLASWMIKHEEELRKNPVQRDLNSVVAFALLPAFESEPGGWNSIRRFPTSTESLEKYLKQWHANALDSDKNFVARVASQLGHPI